MIYIQVGWLSCRDPVVFKLNFRASERDASAFRLNIFRKLGDLHEHARGQEKFRDNSSAFFYSFNWYLMILEVNHPSPSLRKRGPIKLPPLRSARSG